MSKQDGAYARTAADLERKYNFGRTFAEVYGLVSDAQKAAEEAQMAIEGLDHEEIFNRLTNYGDWQGIYRDSKGDVYINASYIKSGKLAAEYIDADNLEVNAANINGTLTANQIDTTNLKVLAANITGMLTATQIDTTYLYVSAANISGTLSASQIDVSNLRVSAANVSGSLSAGSLSLDGALPLTSGGSLYGYMGVNLVKGGPVLSGSTMAAFIVCNDVAAKISYNDVYAMWATHDGCYTSSTIKVYSDKRLKHDISYDMTEEEKLFAALKPCSFRMNNEESGEKHWGFVAQDVVEAAGDDADGLAVVSNSGDLYSVGYGEFTALNTYMIQKLMARVSALEEKLV